MQTEDGYQPDALDLRRHPDTGLYTVPFSCEGDSIVTFAVSDAAGKVLRRFTREGRKGYNELSFEKFLPEGKERYTLTMRTGDFSESLPIRFN